MKESQFHALVGLNAVLAVVPEAAAIGIALGSLLCWLTALWWERKK